MISSHGIRGLDAAAGRDHGLQRRIRPRGCCHRHIATPTVDCLCATVGARCSHLFCFLLHALLLLHEEIKQVVIGKQRAIAI
jgi:hypothetical protein